MADDTILVRGRVVELGTNPAGLRTPVTVEVVHVYAGPTDLAGKRFTDYYAMYDGKRIAALVPFTIGEEGVWSLERNGELIKPAPGKHMPFHIRSRKVDNPRHAHAVALAETVERYAKAKPGERFALARRLTKDHTPEVSAWGVRTLGGSDTPAAQEFLKGLAVKPDLPLAGQVALDEVLAKQAKEDWLESKTRDALLKSWVGGKADEHNAVAVLQRLDMAAQTDELLNKTAVELSRVAAENSDWPWAVRRNAIFQVGLIARRGVDDESAYKWLFDIVQRSHDIEVRRAAAYTLRNYIELYPARQRTVEEYLTSEKDGQVKAALREWVTKKPTRK